jgi:hypothetical protein
MRRQIVALLLVSLWAAPVAGGEAVSVTARADKTDVTVGQRFTVEVQLVGPDGTTWDLPEAAGDERVELWTAPPSEEPLAPGVHRYEATAFALGEVSVPPITVSYRLPDGTEGEAASEPIPLRILSVLPKDPEEQKLLDIRAPAPLSIGGAFWGAAGLLAVLACALVVWLVRRRRRQVPAPAAPATPPIPPDVEALANLDRLAASGLLARGEYRPFYIELTQIGKRYLERRLEAPIVEMTTTEMLAYLRDHRHARNLLAPIRDLSGAADRVKFARGAALAQEAERHLAAVRELVTELEAQLRPRPSEEGQAA